MISNQNITRKFLYLPFVSLIFATVLLVKPNPILGALCAPPNQCFTVISSCADIGLFPAAGTCPDPTTQACCGQYTSVCTSPNNCYAVASCLDISLFPASGGCLQAGDICCGSAPQPTATPFPSSGASIPTIVPTQLCQFAGADGSAEKQKCLDCVGDVATGTKMWTALGCIPTDPTGFVKTFLRIAISVGGGIAFLMIIYGGFLCMTSAGNPEKAQNCREIITSAIAGLLLIIFSAIILRIIGVDILGGLPGFGGP